MFITLSKRQHLTRSNEVAVMITRQSSIDLESLSLSPSQSIHISTLRTTTFHLSSFTYHCLYEWSIREHYIRRPRFQFFWERTLERKASQVDRYQLRDNIERGEDAKHTFRNICSVRSYPSLFYRVSYSFNSITVKRSCCCLVIQMQEHFDTDPLLVSASFPIRKSSNCDHVSLQESPSKDVQALLKVSRQDRSRPSRSTLHNLFSLPLTKTFHS